ncbi:hypothetical protein Tco_1231502 [Tanacetum coccineum]
MSSYNHFGCSWCGGPFNGGNCPGCSSVGSGNEFVYDPNPYSYNETPNFFNQPPQPQYETYSCELCGNDSHYGFDCPPRVPLVYEQEPCYNQNFSDNYYPQNSPSFSQQYLCCDNCGGPHATFQCHPMNQNFNSFGFDHIQPPQQFDNHQPQEIPEVTPFVESKEWIETNNELYKMMEDFTERMNQELHKQEVLLAAQREQELLAQKQAAQEKQVPSPNSVFRQLIEEMCGTKPSRRFNYFYDDDDEESSIPLRDIISKLPPSIAITPVLPTLEPEDSLIMGNEELSTIPEKESDEFIKSSVEDLVPFPSESEDTSGSDSDCDLPSCDNISSINVSEEKSVTFSNPLFDSNDDFTSSDDESLSDEDVPEDNFKTYSNLLFEFDDEYISSDVNPLFDEVLEDIECKDSYDSNLDESTFLVTPLSDSNEDEFFAPGDDIEFLLHQDPSTPTISIVSILEGFTDEPPLEENDDLLIWNLK